ncbi:MAG: HAD-IIIA family hydrolase, partial [Candidatus Saccharimonadales bacterium]
RKALIKAYKDKGYKIIAVTNQAGIELGYTTHEKVKRVLADLDHKLGYVFDEMLYAPGGIKKPDEWRKPNPGMIHHAAEKHGIDLPNSIMVGDKDTDEEAAKRAGIGEYFHAKDFFKEEPVRTPKGAGWL